MDLCNCPNTGPLSEIPDNDCPFDIKQIQKIGFQKPGFVWDTAGTPATDPTLKADWDVLLAATDDTKIVVTPFITGDPKINRGDAITTGGGDNTTLNGIEEVEGVNPSKFEAFFKSLSPEQEAALDKLSCNQFLVVYFINQDGNIFCTKIDATKTKGQDVQSLFVSDRDNQGFGTKDTVFMSFSLPAKWSKSLIRITPSDFNALTDLTNG
ncbi:hypothetical protein PL373_13565 [Tenacibaculum maritimum]|nr:hypothetical protein [Tenacibaculum maritimum]MDB0602157.1 hypothetical protein [Tenacibaculum maritimum]MDB0613833.1 hypothetical protein [Tenacibaculum maritimum]